MTHMIDCHACLEMRAHGDDNPRGLTHTCTAGEGRVSRPRDAAMWEARAEGLADTLHDAWRRGAGFTGLAPFDRTKPHAEQEAAFNRRFRPWMTDPED